MALMLRQMRAGYVSRWIDPRLYPWLEPSSSGFTRLPRAGVEAGVADGKIAESLRGPVGVAGRREAEELELAGGGLLGEGVPVRVEREVSPRMAAGPWVVCVLVAGVGAEPCRARRGDLGTAVKGVGAVGHDGSGRSGAGTLPLIELGPLRAEVAVRQRGDPGRHRERDYVRRAVILGHIAEPDEHLEAAPAQVVGGGDEWRVAEVVAVVLLLVARGAGVLGPQLRGVDADVAGREDRLGERDQLVVHHEAAQRDRRERERDDAAELVAGVRPVAALGGSRVVLLGGGIDDGQVPLGSRELGPREIAGQHDEAITPPGSGGFGQVHAARLPQPGKQRDSFSRWRHFRPSASAPPAGGAAFRQLEGPGAEIGRLWLSTTGVIQEIL